MTSCGRCGSTALYQTGKCRSCANRKIPRRPLSERALSRITIHPETGCWIWRGYVTRWGYGRTPDQGVSVFIHRYFYELVHNDGQRLPPSIHVHHECGEKRCCNPQHLRALDIGAHALHHRAIDKAIVRSAELHRAQTHCKRGHEFTPENTYVNKRGSRICRACGRIRNDARADQARPDRFRRRRRWRHMALIGSVVTVAAISLPAHSATPKVNIGKPAYFDSRCSDAYFGLRWYRAKYDQHRANMGLPLAPPVEKAMDCRRLRERARYWVQAAKVNRLAVEKLYRERGHIIHKLNRGLAGTPMRGLGAILEQEGRAHNISPYFMAAAAGTESSFGAASCSNNPRNVWGLASCTNSWPVPYFDSWREAIRFYARFLANRWPSATTTHHYYGYAACSSCWGRKTAYWMSSRFGVGAYSRYPA